MHLGAYRLSILSFSSSKKSLEKISRFAGGQISRKKKMKDVKSRIKKKNSDKKEPFLKKMSETLFVSTSPGDSDKNIFMKKSEITFLEGAETFGQSEV